MQYRRVCIIVAIIVSLLASSVNPTQTPEGTQSMGLYSQLYCYRMFIFFYINYFSSSFPSFPATRASSVCPYPSSLHNLSCLWLLRPPLYSPRVPPFGRPAVKLRTLRLFKLQTSSHQALPSYQYLENSLARGLS